MVALTEYPELIEKGSQLFPTDVVERAKELLEEIGSVGAYTHSQGVPFIREKVAEFIASASIPGFSTEANSQFSFSYRT